MHLTAQHCHACRLAESRRQVVLPDGPTGGLLAVGEAPGRWEDEQGVGFVGAAGRNLERALAEFGLPRGQWARTNIVRCRPPDNRTPRADEVRACAAWLERTLLDWAPKVILAVGQSAAARLLPPWQGPYLALVERIAEQAVLPCYRGIPVVPMPHTSPLAWNRKRADGTPIRDLAKRAVKRAVDVLRGPASG